MPFSRACVIVSRFDVVARGVTDGSKPNGEQRSLMRQRMLVASRTTVEVLVIDSVERPTEN